MSFPSPGNFPDPGIKPVFPVLEGRLFNTEPSGKPTMEYYSALKINWLLSYEKTWRSLECFLLSERNQSEKAKYYKVPNIWYLGKGNTMDRVKR